MFSLILSHICFILGSNSNYNCLMSKPIIIHQTGSNRRAVSISLTENTIYVSLLIGHTIYTMCTTKAASLLLFSKRAVSIDCVSKSIILCSILSIRGIFQRFVIQIYHYSSETDKFLTEFG